MKNFLTKILLVFITVYSPQSICASSSSSTTLPAKTTLFKKHPYLCLGLPVAIGSAVYGGYLLKNYSSHKRNTLRYKAEEKQRAAENLSRATRLEKIRQRAGYKIAAPEIEWRALEYVERYNVNEELEAQLDTLFNNIKPQNNISIRELLQINGFTVIDEGELTIIFAHEKFPNLIFKSAFSQTTSWSLCWNVLVSRLWYLDLNKNILKEIKDNKTARAQVVNRELEKNNIQDIRFEFPHKQLYWSDHTNKSLAVIIVENRLERGTHLTDLQLRAFKIIQKHFPEFLWDDNRDNVASLDDSTIRVCDTEFRWIITDKNGNITDKPVSIDYAKDYIACRPNPFWLRSAIKRSNWPSCIAFTTSGVLLSYSIANLISVKK